MTIDRWITDADPARAALIYQDETLTYGDFARKIEARCAGLAAQGVAHGDRVAWYGLNHPEVFVLLFACARIGAILLPLNWRLAPGEVAAIVENAAPRLVVYDASFAAHAQALGIPAFGCGALDGDGVVQAAASKEDPLLLVYTSGSTGRPKGVILAQSALAANAEMSVAAHGLTADDTVLNALPLFHVGGLNILPTPAFSIGAAVLLHQRFDPAAMALALGVVNHAICVPTVLRAVMATPEWAAADLSGLKAISIGSTDVPRALIDAAQGRGVPVIQVYGATETAPFAIYQSAPEAFGTAGSLGRAGAACAIRLVSDGQDVPDGMPGEIWVKGANVMREYWRDPKQTAAALTEGWFKTGDVARRDARGLYWFMDRIKHVIISGGENIYPAEIERIIRAVPGVDEVSVVGRADPTWGEVPVAVVVGTAARADILGALDGQLARYKHAKDVVYVAELPRNAMGKVVAAEVRALIGETT